MEKEHAVLMIAAEAHPFAKVGGLADVMGALPRALASLGSDVRIALPYYKSIRDKKVAVKPLRGGERLEVDVGGRRRAASVGMAEVPGSSVRVLLVGNDDLFGRQGIYTDPATGRDFPDNAERFIFFSKAVLKTLDAIGWIPDIVHCHDYQTGFIPAWIKTAPVEYGFLKDTGTVFTIHNLAYQGIYPAGVARKAGFGEDLVKPMGPIEFYGKANMMKAGIVFADTITTVSPTYAREIQTPEFGCGLEGVLRTRADDVVGILNGADYDVWDPAKDRLLPATYTSANLEGKARCRQDLVKRAGLSANAGGPLAGIVSRMVDQKGFDILGEAMEAVMGLGFSLVVLGTGEKKHQDALAALAKKHPGRISVTIGFDEGLAHLIEAGCDVFLMPSKYEPCGLNQMYSMKYGTIPVVRRTGGLADSVRDFDEGGDSTGFVFSDYTARGLVSALERTRRAFAAHDKWQGLIGRAMAQDFSWTRAARRYLEVYSTTLAKKRVVSGSQT